MTIIDFIITALVMGGAFRLSDSEYRLTRYTGVLLAMVFGSIYIMVMVARIITG